MGCVFSNHVVYESKIFYLDSVENIKNKKPINKKQEICEVLMRNFSIKFEKIPSKLADNSIEVSRYNSLYSLSIRKCENENENENERIINKKNSRLDFIESIESSFETLDKCIDQQNFSYEIISSINEARKNYEEFYNKISVLFKKIKLDEKTSKPFLEFYCNHRYNRIIFNNNLTHFENSCKFIRNIKGKLNKLKIIGELNITLDEAINQMDNDLILKNAENILQQTEGKYIIINIQVMYIDSLDDPEMSFIMSIIDGEQSMEFIENIFSIEVTHISIINKKNR